LISEDKFYLESVEKVLVLKESYRTRALTLGKSRQRVVAACHVLHESHIGQQAELGNDVELHHSQVGQRDDVIRLLADVDGLCGDGDVDGLALLDDLADVDGLSAEEVADVAIVDYFITFRSKFRYLVVE
jgi:hypothetical protein